MIFHPAIEEDLNFIRRAWAQDVKDPFAIRIKVRDAVMARALTLVSRPPGAPADTVGGFLVMSGHVVHWYGVKRPWRHMGFGLELVAEAERRAAEAGHDKPIFTRFATQAQKRFLLSRGWSFIPRAEVCLAS